MPEQQTPPASLHSIAPIFPVRNLKESLRFYADMGFIGDGYDDFYAILTRGTISIHLRIETTLLEGTNPCGAYFYLGNGITDLYTEFLAANVPVLSPLTPREWKMNEFPISDPDGNLLRFGQRLP